MTYPPGFYAAEVMRTRRANSELISKGKACVQCGHPVEYQESGGYYACGVDGCPCEKTVCRIYNERGGLDWQRAGQQ